MLMRRLRRPAGFVALFSGLLFVGEGLSATMCAPPEPDGEVAVPASGGSHLGAARHGPGDAPAGMDCCDPGYDAGSKEAAGCPFTPMAFSGGCLSVAALEASHEPGVPPAASVAPLRVAESPSDLLLGTSLFRPPRA